MWLLLTFSCSIMVHECVHRRQVFRDVIGAEASEFISAETLCRREEKATAELMRIEGVKRFVIICRKAGEEDVETELNNISR